MDAGRGLDKEVATRITGWSWPADRCPVCGWPFGASGGCAPGDCSMRPAPKVPEAEKFPRYSTDIAAAWEIVERLQRDAIPSHQRLYFQLEQVHVAKERRIWRAVFSNAAPKYGRGEAMTAPHAVCLAALAVPSSEEVLRSKEALRLLQHA